MLVTCHRPRRRGRGVESEEVALERGRLDAVIARLLFMAGMRRSEVSALRWANVAESTDGDGILVTVRRSKTNQEGDVNDVRFVKDGVARAIRALRAATSPRKKTEWYHCRRRWLDCGSRRRRSPLASTAGSPRTRDGSGWRRS